MRDGETQAVHAVARGGVKEHAVRTHYGSIQRARSKRQILTSGPGFMSNEFAVQCVVGEDIVQFAQEFSGARADNESGGITREVIDEREGLVQMPRGNQAT